MKLIVNLATEIGVKENGAEFVQVDGADLPSAPILDGDDLHRFTSILFEADLKGQISN